MNGLLMCGGQGTRLRPAVGATEKPLVEVAGTPMIDRVVSALRESHLSNIVAAVSPETPLTAARLAEYEAIDVIETSGEGYVTDLQEALETVQTPAVTVTADLPLLTGEIVDRAIETAGGESLAVCVPLSLVEAVGASADTTVGHEGETVVPSGLNVVGPGADRRVVWQVKQLAVNVNRPSDLQVAEQIVTRQR